MVLCYYICIGSQMDKKAKFFKIYANLPLGVRNAEIIVVIDNEPLTWNVAKIEIENNTLKSKEILKELEKMKIIE